jgi:hypothetical protein
MLRFLNDLIIVTTLITAVVHIYVGYDSITQHNDYSGIILMLNGLGFLLAAIIFYLIFVLNKDILDIKSSKMTIFFSGFIVYTVITIIAYFFAFGIDGFTFPIGILTKVIELILVIALTLKFKSINRTSE